MGTAADGVLDSVGEFADLVGTNHLPIGEMQVGRLGRILDLECKRKWNLCFSGLTHKAADREAPLADRLHCGIEKEPITGNSLQVSYGTVNTNNQDKLDYPFGVF